jgi:hypothetical protein
MSGRAENMKKEGCFMKKSIALVCALLLAFSLFVPFAWAEEGKKEEQKDVLVLDSLTWLAHNIQVSYPRGEIRICPAVLEKEDGARDVWLVTVRSLDRVSRGANNLFGALRLAFNKDCQYYNLTKKAILEYVPAGAAIVIAGHSMGGMVVQRIICDEAITEQYEFLNAVTFGSPCVVTDKAKREGALVRFEDAADIIPRFSLAALLSPADYNGAVRKDCGNKDLDTAHNRSYYASAAWNPFDVLGTEGGSAVLKLDMERLVALAARNTYYFERRPSA